MNRIHYENEIKAILAGIIHHTERIANAETEHDRETSHVCRESYVNSLWYYIREEISHNVKEYISMEYYEEGGQID